MLGPEITWDAQKGQFLIFWASTITNRFLETAGQAENHYNHRMYWTTTKDFQTFTGTRLYYDPGFNIIDATLLPAKGRFYLLFKDETFKPPRKDLRMAVADNPEGPFGPPGPPFTRQWVEGPTALRVGDEYIVYFDCYREQRYGAMTSKDLVRWRDVSDRLVMPGGRPPWHRRAGAAVRFSARCCSWARLREGTKSLSPHSGLDGGMECGCMSSDENKVFGGSACRAGGHGRLCEYGDRGKDRGRALYQGYGRGAL